ncbi:agmatinase [Pseudomonas sp. BGr12]|uniref:agmatinase n=1 Tax=Pseudomonas sp. BGr12 TaxID=2936269 RepID=UPI00255A0912|nr:agmatinase [Pseudomonas sp. BJa5]MDL2428477.1 agmatinase [Pseudomonas sp. BJa5]
MESLAKYMAFAGISTFWRKESTRELADVDIAVMGVPFDNGTSNRTGARLGPRAIRDQSLHTGNFHHPWPYDVKEKLKIIDYGDVGLGLGLPCDTTKFMVKDTYEHAKKIYASGAKLLTLGGDHTIPYGMVRAAREKYGELAMVHFDSHQDTIDGLDGEAIFHGSFAHDLAVEGAVSPAHSTQVFIRTDMDNKLGYNIIYAHEALYMSPADVASRIRDNAGDKPVYITFDVDAMDPVYAPGTGTPVPGGPTTFFVREVLRHLQGLNVVGADIVEVAPMYDHSELTALAAATLACDLIYLMADGIVGKAHR